MTNQTENVSPEILEWLERKDPLGSNEAQNLIQTRISSNGTIQTDKPLERVLVIVEKHQKSALDRNVNSVGLNAYSFDEEGYRVHGKPTTEYEEFTQEMLRSSHFSYSSHEASLVGHYVNNTSVSREVVMDRILLRQALGNVQGVQKREDIWYALTLHQNNGDVVRYLENKLGKEETLATIREMEKAVLPAFAKLEAEILDSPERNVRWGREIKRDRGMGLNYDLIRTRGEFIARVIEYAQFELGYQPTKNRG